MITYETHKIVFKIGTRFGLFSWGLLVAIAWVIAGYLVYRQAKRYRDINADYAMQFLLAIFLGVYAGARALHYLGPWGSGSIRQRLIEMLNPSGGWVGFGAIIGAIALSFLYTKIRKINFLEYADLAAPAMILGIAIVRLGCFIAGCCYGSATSMPWAIIRDGNAIHPTQLYNSLLNFAVFLVMLSLMQKKIKERKFHGYLLLCSLMLYSFGRFFTEFVRGDYGPEVYHFGLTLSQLIAIGVFVISSAILYSRSGKTGKTARREPLNIVPKTYWLVGGGGVVANAGAYMITPLPYLGVLLLVLGLAAVFAGIRKIFKPAKKGRRK